MFSFFTTTIQKLYTSVSNKLHALFARPLDQQTLKELEQLLIEAETGVATAQAILKQLNERYMRGELKDGTDLQLALTTELLALLAQTKPMPSDPAIYLLVGVNGS